MTTRLLVGHVIDQLAALPAASVNLVVTSPPYFGLRSYQTEPQVWGGDGSCGEDGHEWGESTTVTRQMGQPRLALSPATIRGGAKKVATVEQVTSGGQTCRRCGAWRGELGSEPTVDLFLSHLVAVFEAVKRVLRPDGCLVVNLGDSFANDAKWGGKTGGKHVDRMHGNHGEGYRLKRTTGIPAKSLLLVPEKFAIAMQQAGWIVRSKMPWVKRSCMPESATDRPTVAHETIFVFVQRGKYWWDAEAVRRPHQGIERPNFDGTRGLLPKAFIPGQTPEQDRCGNGATGRNYRTSDPYFDALDADIRAAKAHLAALQDLRRNGGPALDEDGQIVALDVNPEPTPFAHFATFPRDLVRPFIRAACPERCCAVCGMGWVREVERYRILEGKRCDDLPPIRAPKKTMTALPSGIGKWRSGSISNTLSWHPACTCHGHFDDVPDAPDWIAKESGIPRTRRVYVPHIPLAEHPTQPGTCLDPFVGSGTTLVVAEEEGRDGIGIEIADHYLPIIQRRLDEARAARLFGDKTQTEKLAAQMALFGAEG